MIPARSGSKGLKNKNINYLGKYNLVERAYKLIAEIIPNDQIVISSDYEFDIFSKFLDKSQYRKRPLALSKDDASIIDVSIDTIKFKDPKSNNNFTDLLLIQPTSPFRDSADLNLAINFYKKNSLESLASVSPVIQNPYGIIDGTAYNWKTLLPWEGHKNRQELKSYFSINGCFYIVNINKLIKSHSIINEETYMYLTNKKYCIDIDDKEDFDIAQKILE